MFALTIFLLFHILDYFYHLTMAWAPAHAKSCVCFVNSQPHEGYFSDCTRYCSFLALSLGICCGVAYT